MDADARSFCMFGCTVMTVLRPRLPHYVAQLVFCSNAGYAPRNADVITASLSNLIRTFELNTLPESR